MQRKKSLKKSSIYSLLIFILLVLIITAALYLFFLLFKITKINIITKSKSNLIGIESLKNKNYFLTSKKEIEKLIVERNPQIEIKNIQKKYPNELTISYVLIQPFIEVKANNGYFILSNKGKIIQKNKKDINKSLPKLKYYQQFDYLSYNIGDYLDTKDIQYSLFFGLKVKKSGLNFTSIDITSPNMIRLFLDGSVVYLTTEKDIEIQNNQLLKIINQFKVEGKKFNTLDLRFDKPIIKLN